MKKIIILSCVSMMFFTACVTVDSDTSNINENKISTENPRNENEPGQSTSGRDIEETSEKAPEDELVDKLSGLRNEKGYYQDLLHTPEVDEVLFHIGLPLTNEKLEDIEDLKVRALLTEILEQGYRITDEHEFFGVEINYEGLMDAASGLDNPASDFVEINHYFDAFEQRLVQTQPVNLDEWVSMIIRIEDHFKMWPESNYKSDLNRLYTNQLLFYFIGNELYEVFDFNTNKMNEDKFDLIKKHVQLYTESEFAEVGRKYLMSLEEKEHSYHPEYIQIVGNFKKFGLESHLKLVEKKNLTNNMSVFIPEIHGHPNVTIQESINQIIRDEVQTLMRQTGFDDMSDGSFYFNTYVYTSNPRIMSLECMGSHNLKDWTQDKVVSSTLTFDLKTGEPLTLERYLNQDIKELDGWLLKIVNEELNKYFGDYAKLPTLKEAQFLVQEDALLIIGMESTHRAYVPRWILKNYVNVNKLFN